MRCCAVWRERTRLEKVLLLTMGLLCFTNFYEVRPV
jgi:hypothetical protein